ncbi:MAG TPA: ECF-type sigma factor [Planctomycetota bacterium]
MEDPGPSETRPELTLALRDLGAGRSEAVEVLLPAVVSELRATAQGILGARGASHTLQPTALVNEVFLKLFGTDALAAVNDRAHFFALAARAMRQVLVDHARARRAAKRGGGAALERTLGDALGVGTPGTDDLLDVDEALAQLALLDERQARLVELRFFAGLEMAEAAAALGVSLSTAEREWRAARAWLGRRMQGRGQE